MNKTRIPTILGLAVLILGLALGVVLVNNRQYFVLRADPVVIPKNVRISNITDKSLTVSWVTDKASLGFVRVYSTNKLFPMVYGEQNVHPKLTHYVTLNNLDKDTNYTFTVVSNGQEFYNNDSLWAAKTRLSKIPVSSVISGSVVKDNALPAADSLVYVTVNGTDFYSTVTDESGSWHLSIPAASSAVTTKQTVEVFVQNSSDSVGVAHATFAGNELLVPTMSLGTVQTFTNIDADILTTAPEAVY